MRLKTMYEMSSWFHYLLNHNIIFEILKHLFKSLLQLQHGPSKIFNNFADTKNRNRFQTRNLSLLYCTVQQIHEKNHSKKRSHYCPFNTHRAVELLLQGSTVYVKNYSWYASLSVEWRGQGDSLIYVIFCIDQLPENFASPELKTNVAKGGSIV